MGSQSVLLRAACVSGITTLLLAPTGVEAHPLDDLQPGHWYAVEGSMIQDHFPDPAPPNSPAAIINAWGGGAFDTFQERLLIWGGGHADYGGNEVYAFDVPSQTWAREWGPTPGITSVPAQCSATYPDGGDATLGDDPSARHTYDGMEYMPTTGAMWASGGFLFCGNTGSDSATWLYTSDPPRWDRGQDVIQGDGTPSAAWDPVTERVYYIANYVIQSYDPVTESYEQLTDVDGGWWLSGTSAVDPIRRLLITVHGSEVRLVNIDTGEITLDQPTTNNVGFGASPGMAWDPNLERMVVWSGTASVYSLDTETWEWFLHAPAPENAVVPSAASGNGTYGRFRYMPSRNAYILINATNEPVFYYKLTDGAGVLPPPPEPGDSDGMDTSGGPAATDSGQGDSDGSGATTDTPTPSGSDGNSGGNSASAGPSGGSTGGALPETAGADSEDESGCSCTQGDAQPWWLAGLLVLGVVRRRRAVVVR